MVRGTLLPLSRLGALPVWHGRATLREVLLPSAGRRPNNVAGSSLWDIGYFISSAPEDGAAYTTVLALVGFALACYAF